MKKLLLSTSCALALMLASGTVKAEEQNNDGVVVEQVDGIVSTDIQEDVSSNQEVPEKKEPIIVKNLAVNDSNIWEGIEIIPVNTKEINRVRNDDTIKAEEKVKSLNELKTSEENRIIKAYDDQRNKFLNKIYELKDKVELTDEEKAEIKKIQDKIELINNREDGALMEIEKYFH